MQDPVICKKRRKNRGRKAISKWKYTTLWKKGKTPEQLKARADAQLEHKGNMVMQDHGQYMDYSGVQYESGYEYEVPNLVHAPVWENQFSHTNALTSSGEQGSNVSNEGNITGNANLTAHSGDILDSLVKSTITITFEPPTVNQEMSNLPPSSSVPYIPDQEPISPVYPEYPTLETPPYTAPGDTSIERCTSVERKEVEKEEATLGTSIERKEVEIEVITLDDSVESVETDEIQVLEVNFSNTKKFER